MAVGFHFPPPACLYANTVIHFTSIYVIRPQYITIIFAINSKLSFDDVFKWGNTFFIFTYINTIFWYSSFLLWGHEYLSGIFLLPQRLLLTFLILLVYCHWVLLAYGCVKSDYYFTFVTKYFLPVYRIFDWQVFFFILFK